MVMAHVAIIDTLSALSLSYMYDHPSTGTQIFYSLSSKGKSQTPYTNYVRTSQSLLE